MIASCRLLFKLWEIEELVLLVAMSRTLDDICQNKRAMLTVALLSSLAILLQTKMHNTKSELAKLALLNGKHEKPHLGVQYRRFQLTAQRKVSPHG